VGRLTEKHMAKAIAKVARMSLKQKVRLADKIHKNQPNLLSSVVTLHDSGISLADHELLFQMPLTCYEAMRAEGGPWPLITVDIQLMCLRRVVARLKATEGLLPATKELVMKEQTETFPERPLLAFVVYTIHQRGAEGMTDEVWRSFGLCALNLVEAITWAAGQGGESCVH
jgi:hypothetical protein